MRGPLFSAKMR